MAESRSLASVLLQLPWDGGWTVEGIISLYEPMVLERRRARLEEVLARRLQSVTLLMDELDDPHNRSAIVRTCDAFGIHQVHSLQSRTDFEIHHGSAAGTERWVDVHPHRTAGEAVEVLKARGHTLIATHPDGELTPEDLSSVPLPALIMGNEHRGIQPALRSAAVAAVRVPMCGFVESLNVSVSAALLLRAATYGRQGDLTPEDRRALYARSLFRSVPRSFDILQASSPA